ncbi:MAG: hypothetical protein M0P74_15745 [Syntrophales bacterium]|nr:hypothetical protein [Syntrophales bacterium]
MKWKDCGHEFEKSAELMFAGIFLQAVSFLPILPGGSTKKGELNQIASPTPAFRCKTDAKYPCQAKTDARAIMAAGIHVFSTCMQIMQQNQVTRSESGFRHRSFGLSALRLLFPNGAGSHNGL